MAKELHPMIESMEVETEVKYEIQEAFDKAVLKEATKLFEEQLNERLVTEKARLEEEYKEKEEKIVESLDSYLDTVVDEFISENAHSYEAELSETKVKTLLQMFENMLTVAGVDMMVLKEKFDGRMDDIMGESKVIKLEEKVNSLIADLAEEKKRSETYLKTGIIKELSEGLTMLEASKFEELAEMVPFERSPSYVENLKTIKESIKSSRSSDFNESIDDPKLPKDAFRISETPSIEDIMRRAAKFA